MSSALSAALGGVAALLLVALCAVLVVVLADRRRAMCALETSRADVEALRDRVERLSEDIAAARVAEAAVPVVPQAEYLITTAGSPGDDAKGLPAVPDRAVLSVTLGEPLVKAMAFGYGVRKALSPESRNRITFEMRREVKRARKERRRAAKRSARATAARDRAEEEAA